MVKTFIKAGLLILLGSPVVAEAQKAFPNGDFETWTGKVPTGWVNEYQLPDSTILQYQPGVNSNLAMKVRVHHTTATNTDDYGWASQGVSLKSVGLSAQPVNLTFYSKINVATNDSVRLLITLYNSGTAVGSATFRKGKQTATSGYVFQQLKLNYNSSLMPDSAYIVVYAGDADNGRQTLGTYFVIDKIQFDGTSVLTGINDISGMETLTVVPNPSSSQINISLPAGIQNVALYNLTGEKIYEVNNPATGNLNIRFDELHMSEGIYMLSVKSTQGSKTMKVVYNR